jgi:hypothetical protein
LALLDKALAVDPNYAEAHGLAAWCHLQRVLSESPDLSADMASSLAHAKAVMALRTDDASTLAFAAVAYTGATKDFETAVQMTDHALARNPSNTHALTFGAAVNAWAGRLDLTVPLAERALRCSPFDPLGYVAWAAIARARLVQGEAKPRTPSLARLRSHLPGQARPRAGARGGLGADTQSFPRKAGAFYSTPVIWAVRRRAEGGRVARMIGRGSASSRSPCSPAIRNLSLASVRPS